MKRNFTGFEHTSESIDAAGNIIWEAWDTIMANVALGMQWDVVFKEIYEKTSYEKLLI